MLLGCSSSEEIYAGKINTLKAIYRNKNDG